MAVLTGGNSSMDFIDMVKEDYIIKERIADFKKPYIAKKIGFTPRINLLEKTKKEIEEEIAYTKNEIRVMDTALKKELGESSPYIKEYTPEQIKNVRNMVAEYRENCIRYLERLQTILEMKGSLKFRLKLLVGKV